MRHLKGGPSGLLLRRAGSYCAALALQSIRTLGLPTAVLRRLTALVFILVIAGGAAAGTPLHSHDQECEMGGMAVMDCCKKAREQSGAPEVLAARLCCAINCSQPAPTGSTGTVNPQTAQAPATSPLNAATPPATPLSLSVKRGQAQFPPLNFPPGYIRHSALLI